MKNLTKRLPEPMTLADSEFMKSLLAGVRQKRMEAVIDPTRRKKDTCSIIGR